MELSFLQGLEAPCPFDKDEPEEDECKAYTENASKSFVEDTICPACPNSKDFHDVHFLHRISYYVTLLDNGCPLERHELLNAEWGLIGIVRSKQKELGQRKSKAHQKDLSDGG